MFEFHKFIAAEWFIMSLITFEMTEKQWCNNYQGELRNAQLNIGIIMY